MNLFYRGITYRTAASAVTAARSEAIGRYRGQKCRRSYFEISVAQPRIPLKYRGVEYITGVPAGQQSQQQTAPSVAAPAVFSHKAQSELEQVHKRSIKENIERRLSVARRQGNQTLIYLLEQEQHQLAS